MRCISTGGIIHRTVGRGTVKNLRRHTAKAHLPYRKMVTNSTNVDANQASVSEVPELLKTNARGSKQRFWQNICDNDFHGVEQNKPSIALSPSVCCCHSTSCHCQIIVGVLPLKKLRYTGFVVSCKRGIAGRVSGALEEPSRDIVNREILQIQGNNYRYFIVFGVLINRQNKATGNPPPENSKMSTELPQRSI